ncbi:hypothetical protein [Amycolatopsis sp. WAC 01376]|uniref:hypothetical protein n=1 Tax=Amycolatopsis sp. WAC 01376 TaxID=2203195 RepID=UPI0018F4BB3F|nr:hypothetical protein [Amycolatopsis sp. WAC 01376]
MTTHAITIEFDDTDLTRYSDDRLALAWHVAQANPAEFGDHDAGELTERVGREIIRRWLGTVPPELWHHKGENRYWNQLRKLGIWKDGAFVPHTPPPPDAGDR